MKTYKVIMIRENFEDTNTYFTTVDGEDIDDAIENFTLGKDYDFEIDGDYAKGGTVDTLNIGCEFEIIPLGNEDYKMTAEERKEYFYNRLNEDCGIYLMRAIDKIVELTNRDYEEVCADLGMCNSERLAFLDAYGDEDGWQKDE